MAVYSVLVSSVGAGWDEVEADSPEDARAKVEDMGTADLKAQMEYGQGFEVKEVAAAEEVPKKDPWENERLRRDRSADGYDGYYYFGTDYQEGRMTCFADVAFVPWDGELPYAREHEQQWHVCLRGLTLSGMCVSWDDANSTWTATGEGSRSTWSDPDRTALMERVARWLLRHGEVGVVGKL